MIDPPRLTDDSGDPFEQALLGSARRDHGSTAAQARCIVAATAAAVVATHTAASAATAATAASATTAATVGTASIGLSFVVKAVAIGFAVGLSVQGAVAVKARVKPSPSVQQQSEPRLVASSHTQAPARVATTAMIVAPDTAPTVEPSGEAGRAESPNAAPRVTAPNRLTNAEPPASKVRLLEEPFADFPVSVKREDSLDREVALLDEARRFVLSHSYDRTLGVLERHQRDFPAGALGPEALVIRVQALLGLGRRAEAQALAARFVAVHPNSPVSKRLGALLGKGR